MKKDIPNWVKSCKYRHQAKIQRQNKSPVVTFATTEARFSQVHLYLVRPLPPSHWHTYEVWVRGSNMFSFTADDIPRKPYGPDGANLIIRYSPKNLNYLDLKNIFEPLGHIPNVCIYRDRIAGKSKGFGKWLATLFYSKVIWHEIAKPTFVLPSGS